MPIKLQLQLLKKTNEKGLPLNLSNETKILDLIQTELFAFTVKQFLKQKVYNQWAVVLSANKFI